ncbi:YraN family protein [Flavipsychrobacter stenotrophus]|uniref:UPF0102 protein CJD36_005890 n=1 Tax=Flavipsychrobacter stenotrophus TaxID=2077091 RepID=A0A2S7SWM3_9BACT|nr:YraN family protein [Flavipsychrobacter stenotrophus]PQJ11332.1 YraN family protein [Flavipsychrobacter stenotrophus]
MSKHSEIGIKGEQLAEEFLLNKGYSILNRNWRSGRKEVDIVAFIDNTVVIVEVKTRSATVFGFPEEAVNLRKQRHLRVAAESYLLENPRYINIRFDIVSIVIKGGSVQEIVHFESAFY